MQYNSGDRFRLDLTEEQKRLCDWVAQQAGAEVEHPTGVWASVGAPHASPVPVRQIPYREATAALDLHEEQLTRMLRGMRERLDEIHEMVEAPIVHTQAPYFEVPVSARTIWDNYRRAEKEGGGEALGESRRPELVQR